MYSVSQRIATVTIHEDVMTAELAGALHDCAKALAYETDVAVIIIETTTESFLNTSVQTSEEGYFSFQQQVTAMLHAWAHLPQPIIAVINGHCAQVGLSLSALADFRLGNSAVTFSHEGMALGGLAKRLSALVGKGPAMHMLVGGYVLTADEAQMRGLLQLHDEPRQAATALAQRLAEQSTIAMQYTKESILRGSDMTFQQALLQELDLYMLVQTSDDRMEGIEAYLQKRRPQFKGR